MRILLSGVLLGFSLLACTSQSKTPPPSDRSTSQDTVDVLDASQLDAFGFSSNDVEVEERTIKRNESLYLILDKLDFSPREIFSISNKAQKLVDLKSMRPGQRYHIYTESDTVSSPDRIVWQKNEMEYVVFDWQQDSLEVYKAVRPLYTETSVTSGTINNSLYQTISHNGGSPLLAQKMAKIFGWQVDFFSIRSGDSFKTLYENRYVDDEFYGVGDVLAAELRHRDKLFRAYYFSSGEIEGFFNEEGESVQRALLKAPFEYDHRISSPFSKNRMHPTLNRRRPHNGVDYAAPYGTPILSTGSGVITRAGYRGASGNMVQVKHNRTYQTAYLHLSKFAKGIRPGVHVDQGQVIGYVGSTGRSTGPHLHYEVKRNNRAINPLTMDLPSSTSIPDSMMAEFKEVKKAYEQQLDSQGGEAGEEGVITYNMSGR
ncbi:peptidoglycan DD-metalloendopeptidase family protein [Fodinibius sediminis]|uniref:Peptidase family M23 n=1 Tax=Fodinibius sediminis TaxID=1214077 RepID=A0A521B5U8_9BACT|nr:peptidoglycan DD-metalloendopeptidase family protein [Fodinibius sediminis]SMO42478.1 Peptidase family M23 [Fodinibius sediminis]